MEKEGAKNHTLEQLYERHKQVMRPYKQGIEVMQIAQMTGLSCPTTRAAIDLFDASWNALWPALRGRAVRDGRVLRQAQEVIIRCMVIDKRPKQLKDFHLRSQAFVGQLIDQEFGIKLQVRSIGKDLTR